MRICYLLEGCISSQIRTRGVGVTASGVAGPGHTVITRVSAAGGIRRLDVLSHSLVFFEELVSLNQSCVS